jgi:lactoylglutathione lyase
VVSLLQPAEPVPIRGLFEAHLTVADLGRAVALYRRRGPAAGARDPRSGATFFWVVEPGQAMLGLWSLGAMPMGLGLHVAFDVALEDVLTAPERLRAQRVEPLPFFGHATDEPSVLAWMPAAAVYFHDPDGLQLGYLAMLDAKPRPELGIVPWSEWAAS